jgi:hypothetical protein
MTAAAKRPAGGVALRLDLSRHCLQTELKRRHNRAVSEYFRAEPERQPRLAALIETLRRALEELDFSSLRARYPVLSGGSDVEVRLTAHGARWRIAMGDRVIEVAQKTD